MARRVAQQNAAVSLNPATGEELRHYPYEHEPDLNRSLRLMEAGFEQWATSSPDARAQTLTNMAAAIRRNLESLALMATREMGKPITQSRAEVEKCAAVCDWYAEHGPAMLGDQSTSIPNNKAYISYLQIGGVLAVMPWNFSLLASDEGRESHPSWRQRIRPEACAQRDGVRVPAERHVG